MAASSQLTLPGVGDQIAAAVAESLKHLQIDDKGPSASSIGEEVGKNVAAVLETVLSGIQKPIFDASALRAQILANADAILNLYNGDMKARITGIVLTVTGTGEQIEAALVVKGDNPLHLCEKLGSLVIIQGPQTGSDIDALLALHDKTKRALARVRSRALLNSNWGRGYAFTSFSELKSSAKAST